MPAGTPPPALDEAEEKSSILIVDDLPEKLLVFGTVLEELGHTLVFVRSGREALREVLKQEFAVILLDVNMPDIDGFETAAMIRQHKRSALTPIIFITSYADEMQTARGYALGAVDYILSPVVPHVLRSKVRVFVQLFAMQRQIRRQGDAHAAFVAAQAARRAAEDNDRRSAFLSRASRILHGSLDIDATARELAGLIVPALAAVACVLRADANELREEVLLAVQRDVAAPLQIASVALSALPPMARAALQDAATRRRRFDLAGPTLDELDAAQLGLADSLPAGWRPDRASAVPLLSGDRLLGAVLTLGRTDDPLGAAFDARTLDDLATRAAAALENARLYGSLQGEITERRAAEQELLEASRRKDEFLAMLSHELRNPLAPIRTALEVIRRIAPADPKFNWAADIMVRQLRQMTRLIEELLDVARISQGKIALMRERVDLNAVVAQSVETAQPMVDARGQALEVSTSREPICLQGDHARLAQIVSNLLHNASKYSPTGSSITLSAGLDDEGAVIQVRDHGIGIELALLPRIFDLFTQGGRGLDRTQGGLGVGLTLARRLAELHGGTLTATSGGPGNGSEFTLRIPDAGELRPAEPALPEPLATGNASGSRILVVDDNRDAARSVATFFEILGHEVATAADGLQAIEVANSFGPEVVVLDIGLPLLDGYQVAQRLRQSPRTRDALLIALTGYGQAEDRERAAQAGFDRHFVKPADPAALLACIDAWTAQASETEPLQSLHGQAN
ncbi:MAG: response regulator [Burkholderiaceae bacterium]